MCPILSYQNIATLTPVYLICINKLSFILFNCITIIALESRYSDHFDIIYVTISYLEQILHFKQLWKCSKISCDRPSFLSLWLRKAGYMLNFLSH